MISGFDLRHCLIQTPRENEAEKPVVSHKMYDDLLFSNMQYIYPHTCMYHHAKCIHVQVS